MQLPAIETVKDVAPCRDTDCQQYWPGHHMHFIHAKDVGRTPWGWRDAVVTGIDGLAVSLAYTGEPGEPLVWHHRPHLVEALTLGAPVRLHEQCHAFGCPAGWFNVVVERRVGNVPEPEDASQWRTTRGAVNLATGVALPLDHEGRP